MSNRVTHLGTPSVGYIEQGAVFSPCGAYRYALWRTWDVNLPVLVWILLNPSTADQNHSDPTNTRGEKRARDLGFGTNVFVNLFALRSTDPAALYTADDPIGPANDDEIRDRILTADKVVAAWGNHGALNGRDKQVLSLCQDMGVPLNFLRISKTGQPAHLLYLPYSLKPKLWRLNL